MMARLLASIEKIDTLGRRDRVALALGLLAALVGFESLVVMPMQSKRQRIALAVSTESQSQSDLQLHAAAELSAQAAATQSRAEELQKNLAALGMKDGLNSAQRESLAELLSRTLGSPRVALVSTRGQPVHALTPAASPEAATTQDAAASSAEPATSLFRHRAELTLEGPVPALTDAIDMLEHNVAPLRIERVRLVSQGEHGAVQATVVLTTINAERTWIAF